MCYTYFKYNTARHSSKVEVFPVVSYDLHGYFVEVLLLEDASLEV